MHQPLVIENDALRVTVYPAIGGKVSSVIDKADGFELLFQYNAPPPTAPQYDIPFGQSWYTGWDECFPAIAPGPYPGQPYDGIPIPDHGELWGLPTISTLSEQSPAILTTWHGLRFSYYLHRRLRLDGNSLVAEYQLFNRAPFDFRFVWAMHSLVTMAADARIELPAGTSMRASHDADGRVIDTNFAWPDSAGIDFSKPSDLPEGRGWKLFSTEPISAAAIARYPSRSRSLRIAWSSPHSVDAYWGIWINTGGWAGHRHIAIEPTTGRFDQLDRSVADHSAGRVAPSGMARWAVTLMVGHLD